MQAIDDHFEQELARLETAAAAFSRDLIGNASVRWDYLAQVRKFSLDLQEQVNSGRISLRRAVEQAHSTRNMIMEAQRGKSSALGLSIARRIKAEGRTLVELEAKYADRFFGKEFSLLNAEERHKVWRTIVKKAGEPQVRANNLAVWMSRAGKGLFAVTLIVAIYHVLRAEDKVRAMTNEGVVIGGSVAGGAALGAAGLSCGPAAIACVPVAIFLGSMMGATGADWIFDRIWG